MDTVAVAACLEERPADRHGVEPRAGARILPPGRGDQSASRTAIATALAGRFLALIFEKPSLRTRVTFEVGMRSLGGTAIFLDHTLTRLGERESMRDIARNLERWVQGIIARVFAQERWRSWPRTRTFR